MAGISLDKTQLIAIFLETFTYGIFFTLFWITLWVLFQRQSKGLSTKSLIVTLILMLLMSTAHITIEFVRVIEAFVVHRDAGSGGPVGYYARISHPLHIAKNVLYITMSLTGDVVVAWRCCVVYPDIRLIMVVPTVLLVASTVSGYTSCWMLATAPAGSTIFVVAKPWFSSFFGLTLCTNAFCTGAIGYRVWSSIRSAGPFQVGRSNLVPVLMTLVESGALYASAVMALIITYISGSNALYAALDVVTPIVGIVFSLIIIQIRAYASRIANNTDGAASLRSVLQRPLSASTSDYPTDPVTLNMIFSTPPPHIDTTSYPPSILGVSKEIEKLFDTL
ncbi:hypothetical protein JB92DRAFT_2173841 [Gautieria morchelliformis]|nr:hypothetical protein JB92DRAFT_2173841 [Gautieria morchelliformis]